MAGPLDNALSILGGQDATAPTPAARSNSAALNYLNDPKNRAAIMADADRIAAMRLGAGGAPAAAAPTDGPLSGALAILSGAAQPASAAQPAPAAAAEPSAWDKIKGAGEAALHFASSIPATIPASVAAVSQIVRGDEKYGTQDMVRAAEQRFGQTMDDYTYSPRTQTGQEYAQNIGNALERTGIQGLPVPMLNEAGAALRPAVSLATGGTRAGAAAAVDAVGARMTRAGQAGAADMGVPAATAAAKPRIKLNVDGTTTPVTPAADASSGSAGAAARAGTTPAAADGPLPAAEQARRAQILRDIGIQDARRSVITGDRKSGATDYQTSRLDSPAGRLLASKFDEERAALESHADSIVRGSGGTIGTDQSALYGRGNTVIAPLDSLKQWFDDRAGMLYRAADEQSQGVPTSLERFRSVLADDSEMTNSDRVHLRGAVNAYAKKLDILGDEGALQGNAQQAETIRKFLGENWSPANGKFVAKLKDALDEDVMSAAGGDLYGQARQMWALRKQTLDNPNGIAKIMDASGPEGINRAVPVEKIPDALAGMPVKQFGHVVDTLKNLPPELADQGQAALGEIKAQFANKVLDAGRSTKGQWNQKAVRAYLANNSERMQQVFTPEEMGKFRTLLDAGDILATDQSYPGAAAQKHNLLRTGTMHAIRTGSTSAGAALGGPVGAAVGAAVGEKAAGALGDAAALKAAQKRLVPLSSLISGGQ
jgi:hypothetical protein